MRSIAWAKSISRCDKPCTSWVVSTTSTRLYTLNHSGWWLLRSATEGHLGHKSHGLNKILKNKLAGNQPTALVLVAPVRHLGQGGW